MVQSRKAGKPELTRVLSLTVAETCTMDRKSGLVFGSKEYVNFHNLGRYGFTKRYPGQTVLSHFYCLFNGFMYSRIIPLFSPVWQESPCLQCHF
ncbi:MAG: hypothetical protein HW380_2060 [Magnetococcales bacterium]|nr:hypothetical protein [Magnetococcales bacterium]